MNKTALVASIATIILPGCASIVSGSNQSLSVETRNKGMAMSGAQCKLSNDKGSWFITSPGSTTIHRSREDMSVKCERDGHEPGLASVKSTTKGMAFGNILFGGIIGAGVDIANGAAFDYPTLITVEMGQSISIIPKQETKQEAATDSFAALSATADTP